jgi:hypothetical protein
MNSDDGGETIGASTECAHPHPHLAMYVCVCITFIVCVGCAYCVEGPVIVVACESIDPLSSPFFCFQINRNETKRNEQINSNLEIEMNISMIRMGTEHKACIYLVQCSADKTTFSTFIVVSNSIKGELFVLCSVNRATEKEIYS